MNNSLVRWLFLAVAMITMAGWNGVGSENIGATVASALSCAEPSAECSEEGQFCGETHELVCGYGSSCCPGTRCDGPQYPANPCDNDGNQCRCVISGD